MLEPPTSGRAPQVVSGPPPAHSEPILSFREVIRRNPTNAPRLPLASGETLTLTFQRQATSAAFRVATQRAG
jgi:hypothetical protein